MVFPAQIRLTIFLVAFTLIAAVQTVYSQPDADAQAEADSSASDWQSENRQAALRVQLFLDNEGFGPGKIDGRWGGFTEKAAIRWNASEKDKKITLLEDGGLNLEKAKEIPFLGELLTNYEITEQDRSILGKIPDEPSEKAELDGLPYTSLLELVAEKFHADRDFVREINNLGEDAELKVGSVLKVPNVSEPFELSVPVSLAEKSSEEEDEKESKKNNESESESKEQSAAVELTVIRDKQVVEVRREGKLIHSFPITPGANDNRSPAGNWKVSVISWMPEFRWDKEMLENGNRSNDAFLLPPGPNSPVGIVWIGINSDGIGLHGTPYPDTIGRSRSHGCIRLSNWDALKLGKIVAVGTSVTVK